MSRIRTIKPDFFTHEDLFDAEQESGLPLRLAFAGLWTQCDREGRFNWRHRQLKVAIMPYDTVDFSRVLDALATRGFVVKYTSGGRDFGYVPSWHRHQVINNREKASDLPAPPENIEPFDASATRAPRVSDAAQGEGKGREGKGKDSLSETSSDQTPKKRKLEKYPEQFETFWQAYPKTANMSKKEAHDEWKKLDDGDRQACNAGISGYRAFLKANPNLETIHACRFISKRRFEGHAEAQATPAADDAAWAKRLNYARSKKIWDTLKWGAKPHTAGCTVPANLLQPNDGADWREWEQAA